MRKGFTLIEMLVVIAIIAVLAAIVAPSAFKAVDKGKVSSAVGNFKSIKTAVMAYYADTGAWPNASGTGAGLTANDSVSGWDGPYLDKWPGKGQWGSGVYSFATNATARWVSLTTVPQVDAQKIDIALDGTADGSNGSVTYGGNTTTVLVVLSQDS
jgi:general secretion pathway protein G